MKFNLTFITFLLAVSLLSSAEAKGTSQCNLKKDIAALSKQLEIAKADIALLKKELASLKNQQSGEPKDCSSKIEEQQRSLAGSKEIERVLIKYGNNPDELSALHYAIKKRDAQAVNILLSNGADPNAKSGSMTALMRAGECNQLAVAEALLAAGADVNFAIYNVSYDIGSYAICYAAKFASGDLVKLLLEHGAHVGKAHSTPNTGLNVTPLHMACLKGNLEAAKVLIDYSAEINAYAGKGEEWVNGTPLDWAAFHLKCSNNPDCLEFVKFLVSQGAERRFSESAYRISCPVISGYLKSVGK